MNGKIYLEKDGDLLEMEEREYEDEKKLQKLLKDHPYLIPGDQIDSDNPRQWLLVGREMALQFENGPKNLSIDHLFLDQRGVPTFVEVKRSTNTLIRREVVGQMLDYVANALVTLKIGEIKSKIKDEDLKKFLDNTDENITPEEFWPKVEGNLDKKKVTMIFVADEIPDNLRIIIEFLNEKMPSVEVLAVEVKQFIGEGLKTIVPTVVGLTTEAKTKKSGTMNYITEDIFFEKLDKNGKEFFQTLLDFKNKNELEIYWRTKGFSLNVLLENEPVSILEGYPNYRGTGQTVLIQKTSILSKVLNGELVFESFNGLKDIARDTGSGFIMSIETNIDPQTLEKFYEVLSEVIEKIRKNGLK